MFYDAHMKVGSSGVDAGGSFSWNGASTTFELKAANESFTLSAAFQEAISFGVLTAGASDDEKKGPSLTMDSSTPSFSLDASLSIGSAFSAKGVVSFANGSMCIKDLSANVFGLSAQASGEIETTSVALTLELTDTSTISDNIETGLQAVLNKSWAGSIESDEAAIASDQSDEARMSDEISSHQDDANSKTEYIKNHPLKVGTDLTDTKDIAADNADVVSEKKQQAGDALDVTAQQGKIDVIETKHAIDSAGTQAIIDMQKWIDDKKSLVDVQSVTLSASDTGITSGTATVSAKIKIAGKSHSPSVTATGLANDATGTLSSLLLSQAKSALSLP